MLVCRLYVYFVSVYVLCFYAAAAVAASKGIVFLDEFENGRF